MVMIKKSNPLWAYFLLGSKREALKWLKTESECCVTKIQPWKKKKKKMIHRSSIGMLLEINLSSSTKEWQIPPRAQDQCVIWFNLCLQQIETNQVVIARSIGTFNGDESGRFFVALFVTVLIIFICHMKLDPFCNDFPPKNHNSSIKCHSRPVVK